MSSSKFKLQRPSTYRPSSQSKYACIPCRKSKRKCSKDLAGCFHCVKFNRQCAYNASGSTVDPPLTVNIPPKTTESNTLEPFAELQTPEMLLNTLGFSHLILHKADHVPTPVISKELAGKFTEAFFKHNHRSYPFINRQQFMRNLEERPVVSHSLENYGDFEVYMAMAIGCTTLSRVGLLKPEDNYSRYFSYKCIGYLNKGSNATQIESIKMLLLLCIYSFFEPQGLYSWNLLGLIIRSAITIGLNKGSGDVGVTEEMRNRLFWSIYNLDRLLSISLGRPLSIDENDIDVPLPERLPDEEQFTHRTMLAIISLRQIEGRIIKKLYSIRASKVYQSSEIDTIKDQLDEWIKLKPNTPENLKFFSFHGSDDWYMTRYYHNLVLLYRPSYLVPCPDIQQLNLLGECCLQTLSHTHKLFKANLLPLNWITLYRFLTVCSSTLYCLCNWSIDLNQSKLDIYLSVEILDTFGKNWVFARKCSKVIQNIVDNILDISLAGGNEISNVKKLSSELLGASSAYHEILNDNSVNILYF